MKVLLVLVLVIVSIPFCYGQQPLATKEEAMAEALKYAAANPTLNSSNRDVSAVFVQSENAWIVLFSDQSPFPAPDSDFMMKIDAASAKTPEIIGGAAKQDYYKLFN
jgi:hypothetical protein